MSKILMPFLPSFVTGLAIMKMNFLIFYSTQKITTNILFNFQVKLFKSLYNKKESKELYSPRKYVLPKLTTNIHTAERGLVDSPDIFVHYLYTLYLLLPFSTHFQDGSQL